MILYSHSQPGQYLYAELRRDMALPPHAFARLMRWMLLVSLGAGSILFAAGAWPVVGFLGLDVLLVWGAFKLYAYGHARQYECVVLDHAHLTVQQHSGRQHREVTYEPTFLNIHRDANDHYDPIHICQRGRCCEIGRWLGPEERQAFVRMLKKALHSRQNAMRRSL